jgi:excisionase family DNA binding protein
MVPDPERGSRDHRDLAPGLQCRPSPFAPWLFDTQRVQSEAGGDNNPERRGCSLGLTEVYGHLSTNYLRKEIQRLTFGPPADDTESLHSAGGASEPPRPADSHAKARSAALSPTAFTTRPPPEPSERPRPRMAATEVRELDRVGGGRALLARAHRGRFQEPFEGSCVVVVGARGFEPPTFRSRIGRRSVAARASRSQVSERIANRGGREVQPSQLSTGVSKNFTTRLLPKIGTGFAPGTAPKVATTPTTADLVALHGGRDQLLSVADVAERLGVCAATVYRLCELGELPHVRIVNSIRLRRQDLDAFVARSATAVSRAGRRRPAGE